MAYRPVPQPTYPPDIRIDAMDDQTDVLALSKSLESSRAAGLTVYVLVYGIRDPALVGPPDDGPAPWHTRREAYPSCLEALISLRSPGAFEIWFTTGAKTGRRTVPGRFRQSGLQRGQEWVL